MKPITLLLFLLSLYACDSTAQQSDQSKGAANFEDVEVAAFAELMAKENTVILDVRTPRETSKGIIEGAMVIDIMKGDFAEKIKELDKEKTYLVYCQSGKRSVTACNAMAEQGFTKLYNLKKGYRVWKD
jgi:rhodanese-related sulfurtransferase